MPVSARWRGPMQRVEVAPRMVEDVPCSWACSIRLRRVRHKRTTT
ncbi:hypothetical protein K788_0001748 (plasmid) [Paraburkholderia caribensis MBA4]|uniref:Uncharacterized protein n=1 Tax=Paraburkholderia caribensis MBA4 TaxID=1323664 RepID=A0A0P0RM02_9BURK|nr:hypothetical protein K788_0001748 [Paraburkholderia caribensis MBA4]